MLFGIIYIKNEPRGEPDRNFKRIDIGRFVGVCSINQVKKVPSGREACKYSAPKM